MWLMEEEEERRKERGRTQTYWFVSGAASGRGLRGGRTRACSLQTGQAKPKEAPGRDPRPSPTRRETEQENPVAQYDDEAGQPRSAWGGGWGAKDMGGRRSGMRRDGSRGQAVAVDPPRDQTPLSSARRLNSINLKALTPHSTLYLTLSLLVPRKPS
ncbi:hypothetical protein B0H16DRAFT_1450204 [Mycena metata]|uniref:Uncharacterized protein n=1 Tax=Mycena metata TaxID=1033252 RepID=A0AAD7K084_9AGAR|nr:hypothetical protein B0H16DRAFT_1450204 [Mycena metata]